MVSPREVLRPWAGEPHLVSGPSGFTWSRMLLLTLSCLITVAWTIPSPNVSTHMPWRRTPGLAAFSSPLLPPAPWSLPPAVCSKAPLSHAGPALAIQLPGTEVRAGAAVFRPFPDKLYFYPVTFRTVSQACSRCLLERRRERLPGPCSAPTPAQGVLGVLAAAWTSSQAWDLGFPCSCPSWAHPCQVLGSQLT